MNTQDELLAIKKRFDFNSEKKMIVTFGAPGTGKTTLLDGLKTLHPEWIIISETEKILDENTSLGKNLVIATDKKKGYFQFQMTILPERFNKCFYAANDSLVDDSIFGTYAYSLALLELKWITEEEYEIFMQNFQFYMKFHSKPTKIIHLFCDTPTLKKRIKKRNRKLEIKYTEEYLIALNKSFKKSAEIFSEIGYEFISLDTTNMSEDEVRDIVKSQISNSSWRSY